MERDDVSSGSEAEEDDDWNVADVASHLKERESSRSSIKGMQTAISEGWIQTRGREHAIFSHDRYRAAAEAEVAKLP